MLAKAKWPEKVMVHLYQALDLSAMIPHGSDMSTQFAALGLNLATYSGNYSQWLEKAITEVPHYSGDRMLVFPEYVAAPLFPYGPLSDWQDVVVAWRQLQKVGSDLAKEHTAYLLLCGLEPEEKKIYNTALLFSPAGELTLKTRKVHLTTLEKQLGVSAGNPTEAKVVDLPFGTIGVAICLDAFSAHYRRNLYEQGARILLQPSANPQPWAARAEGSGVWQPEEWTKSVVSAVKGDCPFDLVICPMLCGTYQVVLFDGQSVIVAPSKELLPVPYVGMETHRTPARFLACSPYENKPVNNVVSVVSEY
jgi:predicted amidohydrolase